MGLLNFSAPTVPAGLLGKYYDPSEERRKKAFGAMSAAGAALLQGGQGNFGQVLGQALSGAQQGASNAGINYRQDALGYNKLAIEMQEQKDKERQRAATMQYIDELPEDQKQLAMMNPQKFAELHMENLMKIKSGAGNEMGLVPTYWKDAQGNLHANQLSKSGGMSELKLPEGGQWAPGMQFLDTGTGFTPADKRLGVTGNAPVIPKDLRGAAVETEIGKTLGEGIGKAPADIASADEALLMVESIRNDPNKARGTGKSGVFNFVPYTGGYDFQTKVDQATSGAFLVAIEKMRGLGALSNAEGSTAKQAVTRMTTATTEGAFNEALNDYEALIQRGKDRAIARAQSGNLPVPAAPQNVEGIPQGWDAEDWKYLTPDEQRKARGK